MKTADFRAYCAKIEADRAEKLAALTAATVNNCIRLVHVTASQRRGLISPDTRQPGMYRLTSFDGNEPTGHLVFYTMREAMLATLGWYTLPSAK